MDDIDSLKILREEKRNCKFIMLAVIFGLCNVLIASIGGQWTAWASAAGQAGGVPPWVFIHDTDKVERGLMVLFFCLVFPLPSCGKSSIDALSGYMPLISEANFLITVAD